MHTKSSGGSRPRAGRPRGTTKAPTTVMATRIPTEIATLARKHYTPAQITAHVRKLYSRLAKKSVK